MQPLERGGAGSDVVLFANSDWYLYNFRRSLSRAICARGQRLLLVSPDGAFGPLLREQGFRWEAIAMSRSSLRPDAEIRVIRDLAAILRRERPWIIHNFTIKSAVYGSIAARCAGVPARINAITGLGYVFTNDNWRARLLALPVRMMMRWSLGGAQSRLIVQNPDDQNLMRSLGLGDQLSLIPGSGVDCQRFTPHLEYAPQKSRKRILFCGRILWDKGVAEFVETARRMASPALEFVIAGAPDLGNPAAVPAATMDEWMRSGVVTLLGHVDDMARLMQSVDIFVQPSYREGLSKSLIEAAACALPLIVTDVPGCRDVVRDQIDGLLIPARDASALERAIARLNSDPELCARLGASARSRALLEFEETVVIAKTLAIYDQLWPSRDGLAAENGYEDGAV